MYFGSPQCIRDPDSPPCIWVPTHAFRYEFESPIPYVTVCKTYMSIPVEGLRRLMMTPPILRLGLSFVRLKSELHSLLDEGSRNRDVWHCNEAGRNWGP